MTTPPPRWFDPLVFERAREREATAWGSPCHVVDVTPSTNDDALRAARAGAPHGAVFVARQQTAGRGRRGNIWVSPPGDNLTFSLLLRPELDIGRLAPLPLVVGLALRAVVERRLGEAARRSASARGVDAGAMSRLPLLARPGALVKWPNDVHVDRRKIAGVLIESRVVEGSLQSAVVGIGLNVLTERFPDELAITATSLRREISALHHDRAGEASGEATLSFEPLLAELLAELERRYARFVESGLTSFLPELDAADALRGRRVRIEGIAGEALGITEHGSLRILPESPNDGTAPVEVHAGHVDFLD